MTIEIEPTGGAPEGLCNPSVACVGGSSSGPGRDPYKVDVEGSNPSPPTTPEWPNWLRHQVLILAIVGSNPTSGIDSGVAQLAGQLVLSQEVVGSSPTSAVVQHWMN